MYGYIIDLYNYLPLPARTPETHKETTTAKEANVSMVDLKHRNI